MNPQPTQTVSLGVPSLSPEDAWRLWHQLNQLTQSLWDAYEQQFLQFCVDEAEDQAHSLRLPFD